jgi:hypothetical protein
MASSTNSTSHGLIKKKILLTHEKLTAEQWHMIERKAETSEMEVIQMLISLGKNEVYSQKNTDLYTCGDASYIELIRPKLVELDIVPKEFKYTMNFKKISKKKNGKKKNGKKTKGAGISKEEIIRTNKKRKLMDTLSEMNRIYTEFGFSNPRFGLNTSYVETRILAYMNYGKYLSSKKKELEIFEFIQGGRKVHSISSTIEGVSTVALNDLKIYLDKLIAEHEFSYRIIFSKYPRIIYSTKYDHIFPVMSIKPYVSQNKLIDEIRGQHECLVMYKAMIGSGKTSSIITLSSYIESERRSGRMKTTELIFCCSIEPVRHQVGFLAYNSEIKFGIATMGKEKTRIVNHFSCKKDENRILIIADPESTYELLQKKQDYILFLDEPTVCADQENHPLTTLMVRILRLSPAITILSSATLPTQDELQPFLTLFKNRYPTSKLVTIRSTDARIGCEIYNSDGEIIIPHSTCKTKQQLTYITELLETNPFLTRLYTVPIIYKMIDILSSDKSLEIELPDLNLALSEEINPTQTHIAKLAYVILQSVAKSETISDITSFCTGLDLETYPKIEIDKLFTEHAHLYLGGCLIAVDDPISFALSEGKKLLKHIPPISRLLDKYNKRRQYYASEASKIMSKIKKEEDRYKQLDSLDPPEIEFPQFCQINSKSHFDFFAKSQLSKFYGFTRTPLTLENLPHDFKVGDELVALLFAGVGVYSNKLAGSQYSETVLDLATRGKLAFVIADDTICYGADLPFCHVIIGDDIANKHSIGTIYQLMGRGGRMGRSWKAHIHLLGKPTERRLIKNFTSTQITTIEGRNFNSLLCEMQKAEQISSISVDDLVDEINKHRKPTIPKPMSFESFDTVKSTNTNRSRFSERKTSGFHRAKSCIILKRKESTDEHPSPSMKIRETNDFDIGLSKSEDKCPGAWTRGVRLDVIVEDDKPKSLPLERDEPKMLRRKQHDDSDSADEHDGKFVLTRKKTTKPTGYVPPWHRKR